MLFDENLPSTFHDDAMSRKQCLQIEFLMYRPHPVKVDPALAPGCIQWLGPQEPSWRKSNWVEGLYLSDIYRFYCEAGVSFFTDSIFQPLHSYLKFSIFFGQVFQSRKTQEYCIPFFTILYFQSLNIEELNLERRKLSVLFLVILPGIPTGGCMEHSESVNIIKCHLVAVLVQLGRNTNEV